MAYYKTNTHDLQGFIPSSKITHPFSKEPFFHYLYPSFRGAVTAENKPSVPDADNAAEGKSTRYYPLLLFIMEVTINNKGYIFLPGTTLNKALEETGLYSDKGIAVAINSIVVSRTRWSETKLTEKDNIMVIKATQGG